MDESMPILPETSTEHEYCMVFSLKQTEDHATEIEKRLHDAKVVVQRSESRDHDETFFFLTTKPKVFEKYAEILGVKKMLLKGSLASFRRKQKDAFQDYHPESSYFTSYERSLILLHLIQAPPSRGGAGIDIGKSIQRGVFSMCFPLHDPKEKGDLLRGWVRRPWFKSLSQDFSLVRAYYGEYITIYFAWLQHYTRWLAIPAAPGFVLGIVGFAIGFDNVIVPFYCLFIAMWATLYLESWKRQNSTLICEWDVRDMKSQERVRPSFVGEKRYGVYVNGTFLNLQQKYLEESRDNPDVKVPRVDWSSSSRKWARYSAGFSVLVGFLGIVIAATLGLVTVRILLNTNSATTSWAALIGGILNAVVILILNTVYSKIASFLTEWENHRTESDWERSFIIKSFLFQFVNSYISLIYTAFVKGRFSLFGLPTTPCHDGNCIGEMATLLGTIFLTNIFVGQSQEIAIPWIKSKICLYMEDRAMRKRSEFIEASRAERESKLAYYESTFDDYNEMAIQFGYVTLFAAAFPWAPVMALANNIVELRTDALKLLTGMQRAHPKGAVDIGIWLSILEIINYAAVLTNTGLIFLTSLKVQQFLKWEYSDLFLAAMVAEHVILIIKWSLSQIIPDTPSLVLQKDALRAYNHQKLIEEYASKNPDGMADLMGLGSNIDEGEFIDDDVEETISKQDYIAVQLEHQ